MAKIGTAHLEIKPVVNEEALAKITEAITAAVKAGVEQGMKAASAPGAPTITIDGGTWGKITAINSPEGGDWQRHDHTEYVAGCFRCDLSRDESGGRR